MIAVVTASCGKPHQPAIKVTAHYRISDTSRACVRVVATSTANSALSGVGEVQLAGKGVDDTVVVAIEPTDEWGSQVSVVGHAVAHQLHDWLGGDRQRGDNGAERHRFNGDVDAVRR